MKTHNDNIAAVFTEMENFPFMYLNQLMDVGVKAVYLLLSEEQKMEAEKRRPPIICGNGNTECSRMDYYRDILPNVIILNTGDMTAEHDKLSFYRNYLDTTSKMYLINIFMTDKNIEGLSISLPLFCKEIQTTVTYCGLFSYTTTTAPEISKPAFTGQVLDFIQQKINPCIFWKKGFYDNVNAQWIVQLFSILFKEKISPEKNLYVQKANQLVQLFNNQTKLLAKAQDAYEKSHNELYVSENPIFWTKALHERNITYKCQIEEIMQKKVKDLVDLYVDEHNNPLKTMDYYVHQHVFGI